MLLSGSVGSAKSLLLAHLIVTHCLFNRGAHVGIGRRVFKDLKDTLAQVIRHHVDGEVDFNYNGTSAKFEFPNESIIRPFSWADRHYKKFRSHEFSMFVIEELTENDNKEFYDEIHARIGRLRHIDEKLLVCATNPDEPEHWAFKHWFVDQNPLRHAYKSSTKDNPYLPESYIEQLRQNLDPKMARRMIDGEWLSIRQEVIYHQYEPEKNRILRPYVYDPKNEIHWAWDFNISDGKPLSSCFFQFKDGAFHVGHDLVVQGLRTEDMLEEAHGRGLLNHQTTYVINGDATGKHRDTRSRHSDYEIIKNWLSNAKVKGPNGQMVPINWRMNVPLSNPKVRERHNMVNAWLHNAAGQRRLFVYQDAQVVHEGLMMTKLKPGAEYIEDDSKSFQHVTTALGYGLVATVRERENTGSITNLR